MSERIPNQTVDDLMALASASRRRAYAPYSGFTVGAALLCDDGQVYTGCNIESVALTPGCCAERVAIYKAISDGNGSFRAMAIAGGPADQAAVSCPPCGVCRQVMREFADPKRFHIYIHDDHLGIRNYTLADLLPDSFGPVKAPGKQNDRHN